jgi:hypothetical protein
MGYSFSPEFLAAQRHLARESIQETGFLPENRFWNFVETKYELSIARFGDDPNDDSHFAYFHPRIVEWLREDRANENKPPIPITPGIPGVPTTHIPPIPVIPEPASIIIFAIGVILIYVAARKLNRPKRLRKIGTFT